MTGMTRWWLPILCAAMLSGGPASVPATGDETPIVVASNQRHGKHRKPRHPTPPQSPNSTVKPGCKDEIEHLRRKLRRCRRQVEALREKLRQCRPCPPRHPCPTRDFPCRPKPGRDCP